MTKKAADSSTSGTTHQLNWAASTQTVEQSQGKPRSMQIQSSDAANDVFILLTGCDWWWFAKVFRWSMDPATG
jgi:hypothetical protein